MRTLKDADIKNKTVLFRVDFNVTVEDGQVTEDFRMRAVLSTIHYLLQPLRLREDVGECR